MLRKAIALRVCAAQFRDVFPYSTTNRTSLHFEMSCVSVVISSPDPSRRIMPKCDRISVHHSAARIPQSELQEVESVQSPGCSLCVTPGIFPPPVKFPECRRACLLAGGCCTTPTTSIGSMVNSAKTVPQTPPGTEGLSGDSESKSNVVSAGDSNCFKTFRPATEMESEFNFPGGFSCSGTSGRTGVSRSWEVVESFAEILAGEITCGKGWIAGSGGSSTARKSTACSSMSSITR